jgi:hypothetical protein
MNIRYIILLYFILLFIIFLWKPNIFMLNTDNKKRKLLYLISLIIIISIVCFYVKVLYEWF